MLSKLYIYNLYEFIFFYLKIQVFGQQILRNNKLTLKLAENWKSSLVFMEKLASSFIETLWSSTVRLPRIFTLFSHYKINFRRCNDSWAWLKCVLSVVNYVTAVIYCLIVIAVIELELKILFNRSSIYVDIHVYLKGVYF